MDVNIKVPALEKLLDYAASGIGSVAGPILATWKARRKVEARKIAAKGKAEELSIQAEGQANALQIISSAQANAREQISSTNTAIQAELNIAEVVEQRIQFQEEKRQRNIESVVGLAAKELGDKDVPNSEPDHDFTARFFNDVQDVSSEELQILWARILAGEVESPGSTSIRSLNILKNLDQATARLFRQFCSACISIQIPGQDQILDARVPSFAGGNTDGNALKKYGIDFGFLNVLNEYGLIISDYNSWREYFCCIKKSDTSPYIPFEFQKQQWILVPTNNHSVNTKLKLHGVALTQAGEQLSRVVDLQHMNEYTQDLIKFFATKNLEMTLL